MPSVITSIGETTIAQKMAASEILQLTTVKFFNVDVGGDTPSDPAQDETEPDAQYLVYEALITANGFINPNMVVYSILLDSSIGNFTFTWVGWYTAEGVLFAITHTTPQTKLKTEGQDNGNNFTRNLVFPFSGAQELTGVVVPAATWQLDFTERFKTGETEERLANRFLIGGFMAFNDGFLVTAIAPQTEEDGEATAGWSLSGGSGAVTLDDTDPFEGTHALKIEGQVEGAELAKDLSAAPRDWSGQNGLTLALKGDLATALVFFIEDGSAARNQWNLVNQTVWTEYELTLDVPDVGGNCDYSNVVAFGLADLDAGVIYTLDAIKTWRYNDFAIQGGKGFIDGIRLDAGAATYHTHLEDYNQEAGEPDPLSPPGAGTRTDRVYLDVNMQGDFNTVTPHLKLVVSDQAQAGYIDANGCEHFVRPIATLERTTSQRITAAMLEDLRWFYTGDDMLKSMADELDLLDARTVALSDKLEDLVPVGTIIALHPWAAAPNPAYYAFCDGTTVLGANFPGHETDPVPDLTDSRFLMGGTDYGTGGSNTLLDHTHSCGNIDSNHTHGVNPPSKASGNNSANHTHGLSAYTSGTAGVSYEFSSKTVSGTVNTGNQSTSHTHTTNIDVFDSAYQSSSHQHAIGSGAAPSETSSLPQYFKVIYYLRVA